jgi:surfeit locus 1 family protein
VTVLRQSLIILVGLALAAGMVVLGVWQLEVYQSQGSRTAAARAAAPPLDLRSVAPAGSAITEGFGRAVRFTGRYDPRLQVLVTVDAGTPQYRVLSGLRQTDGSIVPVVRGVVSTDTAPAPPTGEVTETGVLLPSEESAPSRATPPGQLDAVRLPLLAQRWEGDLVGGFVTLSAADAQQQGITPAPLDLPAGKGRLRNGAYAFQWWIFAAFAVAMSIRIARDSGRRDDLAGTDPSDTDPAAAEPGAFEPGAAEITRGEHSRAT